MYIPLKESERIVSEDKNLHLADLIQRVKQELIASSVRSELDKQKNGTPYLLELKEVELELKFYVKTTAEGKVDAFFFSSKGELNSAKEQTARIKFKIHKNKDGGGIVKNILDRIRIKMDKGIYHHYQTK